MYNKSDLSFCGGSLLLLLFDFSEGGLVSISDVEEAIIVLALVVDF